MGHDPTQIITCHPLDGNSYISICTHMCVSSLVCCCPREDSVQGGPGALLFGDTVISTMYQQTGSSKWESDSSASVVLHPSLNQHQSPSDQYLHLSKGFNFCPGGAKSFKGACVSLEMLLCSRGTVYCCCKCLGSFEVVKELFLERK